ncbi:MAG TPA: CotH kinase family protein [Methylomirabilota bacterium]|nr:CotH kinase family protein [Methylomirabilota bacterium]
MSSISPISATDQECLKAWRDRRSPENLRPIIERYLSFVYSSALRRTGDAAHAADATKAVFFVLARRARKLRKRTVLARWLFHVTAVACRKINRPRVWRWFGQKRLSLVPLDSSLCVRLAPHLDGALERLSPKSRDAVLLRVFLNYDAKWAAQILRTNEPRVAKRVARGLAKLAKRLRKTVAVDADSLASVCVVEGSSASVPEGLAATVFESIGESGGKRPSLKLARRTLSTLAWARWRRRFIIAVPTFILLLAAVVGTAWYIDSLTGHSRLISEFLVWSVRREAKTVPGLAQPARPWPTDAATPRLDAAAVRGAHDLFQTTNIWMAHLKFTRGQWKELQPKRIGALPNFLQPNGTALLRNPKAQRSGLAGALGYDFNWTHADLEFGGMAFTNVAARIKGNGTWLGSLYGDKRAFKADLNKFTKGQKLAGLDELTFNNLVVDQSFMSDALAYEFFRDAGVPSPRTAYAWLSVSVEGNWDRKPLGLYAMVEPVDESFVADRFNRKTPIFKPVTYHLFEHLGDDWPAYAAIYDLKTKATPAQQQRVIDFSRLVSRADDAEFAARLGDFLDLDEFARFLAGIVLLSSYDGILSDGQNFYVYLDPRSNKFGFIPWDLDLAWGSFFLLGSRTERERASIWHPWVGENRFLQRVMAVEEFRGIYRAHLEDFSTRLFVPDRLNQRIDEMSALLRSPVAAESDFRLNKFEQAVGIKPLSSSRGKPQGGDRPAHQLKRFIEKRAISVRQQLDGKSKGMILKRSAAR